MGPNKTAASSTNTGRHHPKGVVVDVNVYLHALLGGDLHRYGKSSQQALTRLLSDQNYRIETSEHILNNIYWTLLAKGFDEPTAEHASIEIEDILSAQTVVLDPVADERGNVALTDFCGDPEDNNILALARDSGAAAIVTNDFKDLVSLRSWRNIPILPASKFNQLARGGEMPTAAPVPADPCARLKALTREIGRSVEANHIDLGPAF